jgi:MFS family permease
MSRTKLFFIWFSVSFFSLVQFFLQVSGNLITEQLKISLSINDGQLGFLFSAFFWSFLLVQVPTGILLDKYGCKKILPSAVLILMAGCIGFIYSETFFIAVLFRIIMGVGAGFGFIGMVYTISETFSITSFPLALGLGEFIGMVGCAAAQYVAPHLIFNYGWVSIYWISLLACLLILVLMFLCLPDNKNIAMKDVKLLRHSLVSVKELMTNKTIICCSIFCFGIFSVLTAFVDVWGAAFVKNVYNISYSDAARQLGFVLLGIAVGSVFLGWLTGKVKATKGIALVAGSLTFLFVLVMMYPIYNAQIFLSVLLFVIGFFASSYLLTFTMLKEANVANIGVASAFCNGITLMGAVIFQPLTGYLLSNLPHSIFKYQYALSCFPIAILLGMGSVMILLSNRLQLKKPYVVKSINT